MEKNNNSLNISGAIIIAGAIIAIAIIWSRKPVTYNAPPTQEKTETKISMAAITNKDHILGNPTAKIKIVEYSDASCPFCKLLHPTMKKIIDKYGASGDVAWVYRHFPLDKPGSRPDGGILHPNAGHEAQAMECATSLGGNDAFWKFTNRLYEITPSVTAQSPDGLDQKKLPEIASYVGINTVSFNECLADNRFKSLVEEQYLDGLDAGVSGTPMNIFVLSEPAPKTLDNVVASLTLKIGAPIEISSDRQKIRLAGALPESAFTTIIDALLNK